MPILDKDVSFFNSTMAKIKTLSEECYRIEEVKFDEKVNEIFEKERSKIEEQ